MNLFQLVDVYTVYLQKYDTYYDSADFWLNLQEFTYIK